MNTGHLKKIIEKYESGETSRQEEEMLGEYLRSNNIPPELKYLQAMFSGFEFSASGKAPDISHLRNNFNSRNQKGSKIKKMRIIIALSAAAIITILFLVISPQITPSTHEDVLAETYDDPEEAYKETRNAILMLSSKLNEGLDKARSASAFERGVARVGTFNLIENN